VADVVAAQKDMKVIGVSKTRPMLKHSLQSSAGIRFILPIFQEGSI